MIDLQGKKILFISPSFFGYEDSIRKRLVELGAKVDYFDERPANTFWSKAFVRMNRSFLAFRINRYYNRICLAVSDSIYDYVFVVNIEAMPYSFLRKLRDKNPQTQFILYMWDSISNKKSTVDYLPLFDFVFSFDKNDCREYSGIYFRPLFYLNEYKEIAHFGSFEYDFSFIGTAHSDRYVLIQKMQNQIENFHFSTYWYLFLQNWKLFIWSKLTNSAFSKAKLHDFHYVSLSKKAVLDVIKKSRIVIDIQHPKQSGLTMRAIEMLGANRKLITTNASIKEYDFYQEDNILVVDRNNPVISDEFCLANYKLVEDDIYYKYSLDGWLEEIFSNK